MPGLKTEFRAPVIDEVVFRVEAAVHKLGVLFGISKGIDTALFNQWLYLVYVRMKTYF